MRYTKNSMVMTPLLLTHLSFSLLFEPAALTLFALSHASRTQYYLISFHRRIVSPFGRAPSTSPFLPFWARFETLSRFLVYNPRERSLHTYSPSFSRRHEGTLVRLAGALVLMLSPLSL